MGGSEAIIGALIRGLEKHGGRMLLRSHVDQILTENGRAAGVVLRSGGGSSPASPATADPSSQYAAAKADSGSSSGSGKPRVIRARKGVVSNASVWDTAKLLPPGSVPDEWRAKGEATPQTGSFVHLHLGIDATGLPEDLDCHHLFVKSWDDLEAPQNVRIASIPTVFDKSLAPPGKAVGESMELGVFASPLLLNLQTTLKTNPNTNPPPASPRLHRRQRALQPVGGPPARHPGVQAAQGGAQPVPLGGARAGRLPSHLPFGLSLRRVSRLSLTSSYCCWIFNVPSQQ
jgi:hypothetical protein